MRIHPELMHVVQTPGMSSHPSIVGARDQIHAHFLEHLVTCEVPKPALDNRDRYLLIAALDYATSYFMETPTRHEGQAYMATVIAALLLEAGFEVVLDDDDSDGPGV